MILKTDKPTEMIGCLCPKFFPARFTYLLTLFTDTSDSFQLLPFSTQFQHHNLTGQCSSPFPALRWQQTVDTAQLYG